MSKLLIFLMISLATILNASYTLASEKTYIAGQKIILNGINDYRVKHKLNPLALNNVLCEQAQGHSLDMARGRISFGHGGFKDRMQATFCKLNGCQAIAENVAFTPGDPREAITLWLKSSGHRKNIEGNYDLTGIGLAQDRVGYLYITQIFVSRPN